MKPTGPNVIIHPPPPKTWRRSRPIPRVTREGKVFVLVTLGVGVAAVNTGNNLLFLMLGLMLSLILLSMIMSELVLRRVRVERRLPERAFVGTTALVEVALANEKQRSASYSLEVEDRAEGIPTERRCYFLKVAAQSQQVAAYRRTPKKRGVLRLNGFRLATRYPFGLFEKWRIIDAPCDLLVYPALVPVSLRRGSDPMSGADAPSERIGHGMEVAGMREYRAGDEARAIHWRRSASLGQVVVREHQRDEAAKLTIVLDNARPPNAGDMWDEAFERAISQAASMAALTARRGTAVEVLVRGARSPLVLPGAPADPIWKFLALLEPVPLEGAPALSSPSTPKSSIWSVRPEPNVPGGVA